MARARYEVLLAPGAVRQLRKLDSSSQKRIRRSLAVATKRAGTPGSRGGKTTKTLRGPKDDFVRLRVGDYRVMYDVLDDERTLLVLGIVHRRDLERWLGGR